MQSRNVLIVELVILALSTISGALEIPSERLRVISADNCYIPYISNHPLFEKNDRIKNVILAIHSSNHDAFMIYNNCMELINLKNLGEQTLIIAPQFLMENHMKEIDENNLLFWNAPPFRGSSISTTQEAGRDLRISAYSILEFIMSDICNKKFFPNIQRITILGHSAGGQLVNRFAASNTVEDEILKQAGIHCKYIVMNPSSYVYFSPKRPVSDLKLRFAVPTSQQLKKAPGYNDYPHGLNKLYSYHRKKRLNGQKMKDMYVQRNVIYLLGEKDCTANSSMSTHSHSMLQGSNRLERGKSYFAHLIDEFGPTIKEKQKLVIIPNVGHSGRDMILSRLGQQFILK